MCVLTNDLVVLSHAVKTFGFREKIGVERVSESLQLKTINFAIICALKTRHKDVYTQALIRWKK
jgi:hypothetical protein